MLTDNTHLQEIGVVVAEAPPGGDGIKLRTDWKCEQWDPGSDVDGPPDRVIDIPGNLLLTAGATLLLNLLCVAGGTGFDNTHAWIGVGDSATAESAGQTDLQGTLAATKAITAASNAAPINVTAVAHGYTTGDTVTILAVGGNTAANGSWSIIVTGVDNFTLNGSTGNGAYTSGGTAAKGNRMRVIMDATYPSVATNVATFRATFTSLNGNFAWAEWGLFNAGTVGTMLNRKVQSLGTKVSGATWVFTVTLTAS